MCCCLESTEARNQGYIRVGSSLVYSDSFLQLICYTLRAVRNYGAMILLLWH